MSDFTKELIKKLSFGWEFKTNLSLEWMKTFYKEDVIIRDLLLAKADNIIDAALKEEIAKEIENKEIDVLLLKAELEKKQEQLAEARKKQAVFFNDNKEKQKRINFINKLLMRRELCIAKRELTNMDFLTNEEQDFVAKFEKRMKELKMSTGDDELTTDYIEHSSVLVEWENLRSNEIPIIEHKQEKEYWKQQCELYQETFNDDDEPPVEIDF
jgi:hypothetical protein